jgi:hypothetical protein
MKYDKKGLIVSLTSRKCFRSFKRAVSFDTAHIIFGNSELKILTGKKILFSNFGVNNGYYEKNDCDVDTLLG